MRINIPGVKAKDPCVRALYLINLALSLCEDRMIIPTLEFFASRYGYTLIRKGWPRVS